MKEKDKTSGEKSNDGAMAGTSPETWLQHFEPVELAPNNRALVPPIYQSVKFSFDSYEEMARDQFKGFFYSRAANPTVRSLELELARLQGRDDALCVGSGVAALAVPLLALLKQGDHVILFSESYPPTRYLVRRLLGQYGVSHTLLHTDQIGEIEKHLQPGKTRLIVFESPTNPSLSVLPIARLTAAARSCGALTLLDNTFAGLHQHGRYDVDIFVHSLTKFASGHGDVMGGAVIGAKALIDRLRPVHINVGATLDPHAAFLVQRGLKTYFIRYRQQSASALKIAEHLARHPRVAQVRYPGLPSHPQHQLAREQMTEFGGVISFDLAAPLEAPAFIDRSRLFTLAGSLGSTESLVAPSLRFYGADLDPETQKSAHLHARTLRLSIGLESADDLIRDLDQALGG